MRTEEIITRLFCLVDDTVGPLPKRSDAGLYPSEVVTLGLLEVLKGKGFAAFYRWLAGDFRPLFPHLPDRTRLQRLLVRYADLTDQFLADPQATSIIDSYGIELVRPIREQQGSWGSKVAPGERVATKGISNHRWIVGIKLCLLITPGGETVAWGWEPAHTHDQHFQDVGLLDPTEEECHQILSDSGFYKKGEQPPNWQFCQRGQRNERMVVERLFSVLTGLVDFKHCFHRKAPHIGAYCGYAVALANCLFRLAGNKLAFAQFSL